jgi:hypothetical protein
MLILVFKKLFQNQRTASEPSLWKKTTGPSYVEKVREPAVLMTELVKNRWVHIPVSNNRPTLVQTYDLIKP